MSEIITIEELAEIITTCVGVEVDVPALASSPSATFSDLDVDSLGLLSVVAELENRFGLILGAEAEETKTPHQLADVVNRRAVKVS